MNNFIVNIKHEIPLKTLNDFIITAIEGGSNYWYLIHSKSNSIIRKYVGKYVPEIHGDETFFMKCFSEAILPAVMDGNTLEIFDLEDPDGLPVGKLSMASIQHGINMMAKEGRPELAKLTDSDNEDFDAGDADVVFQYITLGEIVYG